MFVDPGTIRTWWPGSERRLTPQQKKILSTKRIAAEPTGFFMVGASEDRAVQTKLGEYGFPGSSAGLSVMAMYREVYALGVPASVRIASPAGMLCTATLVTRQDVEITEAYPGTVITFTARGRRIMLYPSSAPRSPEALMDSALAVYGAHKARSKLIIAVLPCFKQNVKGSTPWLRGLPWGQTGTVEQAVSVGEIALGSRQEAETYAKGVPIIGQEGLVMATFGETGLCYATWVNHGSWVPAR